MNYRRMVLLLIGTTTLNILSSTQLPYQVTSPQDVISLFALSAEDIPSRVTQTIEHARKAIQHIQSIPAEQRTFENTVRAYDTLIAGSPITVLRKIVLILNSVHPDADVRATAQQAMLDISSFVTDELTMNVSLYQCLQEYVSGNGKAEPLTPKQRYYIEELIQQCTRNGLNLPTAQRALVASLEKEITELCLEFENNIANDMRTILFDESELAGVPASALTRLQRTETGTYIVGTDYPTYHAVMQQCTVATTRQQLWKLFTHRAYPHNEEVLKQLLAKRHQFATLLGFPSFAHLNIAGTMAQTPEQVTLFLEQLLSKVQHKQIQEIAALIEELPESVQLVDGKIQPWDMPFLTESYKKKHLNIDTQKIAEYFPMETTYNGLLDIYRVFFNLEFTEHIAQGLWHSETRLLEVSTRDRSQTLGYILLDLHPRPYKFTHACAEDIIVAQQPLSDCTLSPALAVVIANFPKNTDNSPALWHYNDEVRTFFHEFGHALHMILGRTKLAGTAGTNVKVDFVEMPSQTLELWLHDAAILQKLSSHYLTKEPLPQNFIEIIHASRQLDAGIFLLRQINYAFLSLELYLTGHDKDPHITTQSTTWRVAHNASPYTSSDHENRSYCAFGHLTLYGARYYGYLWSNVYALDIFSKIEQHGLLNPTIGQEYIDQILGQGGSADPHELLCNFLGREPNNSAFLRHFGIEEKSTPAAELSEQQEIVALAS